MEVVLAKDKEVEAELVKDKDIQETEDTGTAGMTEGNEIEKMMESNEVKGKIEIMVEKTKLREIVKIVK